MTTVGTAPEGRCAVSGRAGSVEHRGGAQDLRRRSVVVDQLDHPAAVCRREVAEVRRVGAVPAVDRLVRVTDDAQVLPAAEPARQVVLERVHVLELVDEQVPEAPPLRVGERPVLVHGRRAVGQQVVEVDDPALPLLVLVLPVERPTGSPGRPVRRSATAAACAYPSGPTRRAFAHSISDASSGTVMRLVRPRMRRRSLALRSSSTGRPTLGTGPARELGQRDRVEGAGRGPVPQPSAASRVESSAAAFRVKVRARTQRIERAGRRPVGDAAGEDLVLPDPAPARMHIGFSSAVTALRCAGSTRPAAPQGPSGAGY